MEIKKEHSPNTGFHVHDLNIHVTRIYFLLESLHILGLFEVSSQLDISKTHNYLLF